MEGEWVGHCFSNEWASNAHRESKNDTGVLLTDRDSSHGHDRVVTWLTIVAWFCFFVAWRRMTRKDHDNHHTDIRKWQWCFDGATWPISLCKLLSWVDIDLDIVQINKNIQQASHSVCHPIPHGSERRELSEEIKAHQTGCNYEGTNHTLGFLLKS